MRRERDWSAQQAHEALREGLGLAPKSRAAYVAIEDGRPLRPREETFLRAYFNGGPTGEDADPSAHREAGESTPHAGLPEHLAAITAQTAAMNALVSRLDQLLPSDRVREMLAWAAEHMPDESLSPAPTQDLPGSRARS